MRLDTSRQKRSCVFDTGETGEDLTDPGTSCQSRDIGTSDYMSSRIILRRTMDFFLVFQSSLSSR